MRFLRKFLPRKQLETIPSNIKKLWKQDISCLVAPQTISVHRTMHMVTHVSISLYWTGVASANYGEFGADGAALTNGISIRMNGEELINIRCGHCLSKYTGKVTVLKDATEKSHSMSTNISFLDEVGGGVNLRDLRNTLEVVIQDDLSGSANTACDVVFHGWYI